MIGNSLIAEFLLFSIVISGVCFSAEPTRQTEWSQPPDTQTGFTWPAVREEYTGTYFKPGHYDVVTAAAWSSDGSRPITMIRWWASYAFYMPDVPGEVPFPDVRPVSFILKWYANEEGADFDRPGRLIKKVDVPLDRVDVSYYESGETVYQGQQLYVHIFQYDCDIEEPWEQEAGATYWISIQAVFDTPTDNFWAWLSSAPGEGYPSSVSYGLEGPDWERIDYPNDHPFYGKHYVSLAMELYSSPVWIDVTPSTMPANTPTGVGITVDITPFSRPFTAYMVALLPDGRRISFIPADRARRDDEKRDAVDFPCTPIRRIEPAVRNIPHGLPNGVEARVFSGSVSLPAGDYLLEVGFFDPAGPIRTEDDAFMLGAKTVRVE